MCVYAQNPLHQFPRSKSVVGSFYGEVTGETRGLYYNCAADDSLPSSTTTSSTTSSTTSPTTSPSSSSSSATPSTTTTTTTPTTPSPSSSTTSVLLSTSLSTSSSAVQCGEDSCSQLRCGVYGRAFDHSGCIICDCLQPCQVRGITITLLVVKAMPKHAVTAVYA